MYITIQDFRHYISINKPKILSEEIISNLKSIENKLDVEVIEESISQYQKNKQTHKNDKLYYQSDKSNHRGSLEKRYTTYKNNYQQNVQMVINKTELENIKSFIPTTIDKKEGIDKTINDIRIYLNKITNKNYEIQKEKIFQLIEDILKLSEGEDNSSDDVKNENLRKIARFIFEISSSNKFFCELYANLYNELINKYTDIFIHTLNDFVINFKESIQTFSYCDPDKDYDKYCLFVKESDKKKAITTFIIMLLNRDVISREQIIEITQFFTQIIQKYIDESNRINEVEELGEILYILISLGNQRISELHSDIWKEIITSVRFFTTLKIKEHKSISSRFIFKMNDVIDLIKLQK